MRELRFDELEDGESYWMDEPERQDAVLAEVWRSGDDMMVYVIGWDAPVISDTTKGAGAYEEASKRRFWGPIPRPPVEEG